MNQLSPTRPEILELPEIPQPEKYPAYSLLLLPFVWLAHFAFLIVFTAYLVGYDWAIRLSLQLLPTRASDLVIASMFRSALRCLNLVGTSFSFEQPSNLQLKPLSIIVSNRQSIFDIPLLRDHFRELVPRFVAKIELKNWVPTASIVLRATGAALVDRGNPKQAISELKKFSERMKAGSFSAIIFPEGTRRRDGNLLEFHHSGLITLLKQLPDSEIIPVAIDNSWKLTHKKFGPIPWFTKVRVKIGEPIARASLSNQELCQVVEAKVKQLLAELRGS